MMRGFWIACAVSSLALGCGARPLEPRDPDPGAFHFRIESYNVLDEASGNPYTLWAIGIPDAEIVCLQEITPEWQAAIEQRYASRYPYRLFKPVAEPAGAAGMGIMSRFPVRDGGWHEGMVGGHPAWHYFVDTPHGTIKVLNTHLRNAVSGNGGTVNSYLTVGDDHVREIQLFTSENPTQLPTLIVGDFNEGPEGAAVQYLEQNGFTNALPLYHPGQPTERHTSLADQFSLEIDHILFDGSFEPLNAWALNEGESDHLPVVAHLEASTSW
jgi:endonuclease/exonuclease/phosphatase family metal-dependent hydrolase